mgnify:CR=1 FL=1
MNNYTIGIDYGTSSVRSVIVDCSNGVIVGSSIYNYPHGVNGVMGNKDPNTARQHPDDYIEGLKETIKGAIKEANIEKKYIRAIGIDATASTPIPLDVEVYPWHLILISIIIYPLWLGYGKTIHQSMRRMKLQCLQKILDLII